MSHFNLFFAYINVRHIQHPLVLSLSNAYIKHGKGTLKATLASHFLQDVLPLCNSTTRQPIEPERSSKPLLIRHVL